MKTKDVIIKLFNLLLKLISWFGKFFEDQRGNPSSKRAIAYFIIYTLYKMAMEHMYLKVEIDRNILIVFLLIELVCLGTIGSEFFNKFNIPIAASNKEDKPKDNNEEVANS